MRQTIFVRYFDITKSITMTFDDNELCKNIAHIINKQWQVMSDSGVVATTNGSGHIIMCHWAVSPAWFISEVIKILDSNVLLEECLFIMFVSLQMAYPRNTHIHWMQENMRINPEIYMPPSNYKPIVRR